MLTKNIRFFFRFRVFFTILLMCLSNYARADLIAFREACSLANLRAHVTTPALYPSITAVGVTPLPNVPYIANNYVECTLTLAPETTAVNQAAIFNQLVNEQPYFMQTQCTAPPNPPPGMHYVLELLQDHHVNPHIRLYCRVSNNGQSDSDSDSDSTSSSHSHHSHDGSEAPPPSYHLQGG